MINKLPYLHTTDYVSARQDHYMSFMTVRTITFHYLPESQLQLQQIVGSV